MAMLVKILREYIALWLILGARRATLWGFTDDYLAEAETHQRDLIAWTRGRLRTTR